MMYRRRFNNRYDAIQVWATAALGPGGEPWPRELVLASQGEFGHRRLELLGNIATEAVSKLPPPHDGRYPHRPIYSDMHIVWASESALVTLRWTGEYWEVCITSDREFTKREELALIEEEQLGYTIPDKEKENIMATASDDDNTLPARTGVRQLARRAVESTAVRAIARGGRRFASRRGYLAIEASFIRLVEYKYGSPASVRTRAIIALGTSVIIPLAFAAAGFGFSGRQRERLFALAEQALELSSERLIEQAYASAACVAPELFALLGPVGETQSLAALLRAAREPEELDGDTWEPYDDDMPTSVFIPSRRGAMNNGQ